MGTVTTTQMTLADFERLDTTDQVELLKGELIRMPPAQLRHNDSAERLRDLLKAALDRLRASNPDASLGRAHHEMGYLFPGDPPSWLQPDVSLTHAEQPSGRYYEGAPLMAFEIVSEHDGAGELEHKVATYLEHGAEEVWVIYPDTRHAWVYRRLSQEAIREEQSIHSELLQGVEIPFSEFL